MKKKRQWVGVALLTAFVVLGAWWRPRRLPLAAASPAGNAVTLASGGLALTAGGETLLIVNTETNSLSLLDTATQTLIKEIPVGHTPRAVAVNGSFAYVANEASDTLSVVDLTLSAVIETVPVGDRPVGVAVAPTGELLAVAELGSDQVRYLAADSFAILALFDVHDRPYSLAFTPDGRYLLATHLLDGRITRLPAKINLNTPVLAAELTTIATWLAVAPAAAVMVNGAGTRAYLPQTMANGQGLNTNANTTVFPKVSVLNLESWQHQISEHISLPEADQPVGLPWAVALARADSELWVVNAASNDVSVIDISNPTLPLRRAHLNVGANPRAIVVSQDGTTAYVSNTLSGTVSVIDAVNYTVSAEVKVTDLPLPPLLLAGKRLFYASDRPDVAQAAWISCNTCHIEGEHDGRTWQLQFLGNVPPGAAPLLTRNTTSLLGMVETYPLRWSAEWDEAADSEFSIRFEQFGTGLLPGEMHPPLGTPNQGRSAEMDALAAYLDSLALPERAITLSDAARRGQAIFESRRTGCAECHPAPLYTNWRRYDVGTATADNEWLGPAFDTPTLRFLYDSAPYLHDGSAATLRALLTDHNPNDDHGVTSHLDEQALADLISFLLSLPFE